MRDAVLEPLPCWRSNRYVVRIVNTPICPRINLLAVIRIHNDRVHGDIRKIASLIHPCERTAVGSAGYLKHVPGRCRRIWIESAHANITYRKIGGSHCRIKRNAQHRAQRQNRIVPCDIHPIRLRLSTGPKIKSNPYIGVVCADYGDTRILR